MNSRALKGRCVCAQSLMCLAICGASGAAQASNGLNLVGFGAESLGLGSADIAMARDSTAVNINPAGLTQIEARRFDGYLVPFYSFGVSHSDANNADYKIDTRASIFNGISYAQQALHPDLRFGIGLFLSGGTGIDYDKLNTGFGTRDEYSAVFGITKLATGVGWKVSDKLSLGAGVNLAYAQARQKIFPNTSDEASGFFGVRLDGADGLSVNGRIGMQYRVTPALTLGASYASETEIKLEGGTFTVNYGTFQDLGRVKYGDASVDGFALAQELGIGLAWQFTPRWLFAGEVTWLDWSSALRDSRLLATRPENPNAPAVVDSVQELDHKDQYVVGLGLAYGWNEKTILRVGTNIARNPIPNRTLTPVLNLTADWEMDMGLTRKLSGGWEFSAALQIQPHKSERYDNPAQPFANFGSAREDYGVAALTVQLSRSW